MEFAASIPTSYKVRWGQKKWLLRRAYRRQVPHSILNGPKRGFGVPLARWFRNELRPYAQDVLLDSGSAVRDYLRQDQIASLLAAHNDGRADHAFRIWALLQLELWHKEFGGGPAA
jgi:asparagine synthase (glutamine-hydrolysing)